MTEILIAIKNRMPRDIQDFFSCFFPRSVKLTATAVKLFNLVKEKKLTATSYLSLTQELNITKREYYYVLSKLKQLGIISKLNEDYVISKDFIKKVGWLIDYYESLIQS